MKRKPWQLEHLNDCQKKIKSVFVQDKNDLVAYTSDFGKIIKNNLAAAVLPTEKNDVCHIIEFANQHQLPLTIRGKGLSQGGQTITVPGGVTLQFSQFNRVSEVDLKTLTIRVDPGASWRSVVKKTLPLGLLPNVVTLNLDLTVGGTLSVGGIGANSYRYGPICSNVKKIEVVTGGSEILNCSENENVELFHAVLGGVGRYAVITEAELKLRKVKPKVRTFYLLYTDHKAWIEDQLFMSQLSDYLEGYCSASIQGLKNSPSGRKPFAEWFFPLQISFEYDETPPTEDVLGELHYWRLTHVEDNPIENFLERYQPRFELMEKSGAWHQMHPWIDCMMSIETLKEYLPEILNRIPLALGDGHRVFLINNQNLSPLFMSPAEKNFVVFNVLPVGVPAFLENDMLQALSELEKYIKGIASKRYLAGYLGKMRAEDWQKHYGEKYDQWIALKQKYDPNHVLTSALFEDITTPESLDP